ncbi:type III secretion system ATPase, FliI/YscN [Acetomicrobium mobile DSM 13181]|uniref:Type III secretion system ATPase, FliI/YscN n=1 Tax=Acetomicrobium mobile (strain ATCC BAA-54 / DSM 13181 / JCM 12221 / NGA) TaxID=891968 RepID=I4BUG7_ACEMN|nr:flagellar protein export ATPase FliI [Acetomicrobium mobile]AFM20924.1 type III secretion system ATPase, FliI/YscN [Acetomicrobium mobile DSM 13181]
MASKEGKDLLSELESRLDNMDFIRLNGLIAKAIGIVIESKGPDVRVGDLCEIRYRDKSMSLPAEVVGFSENRVLLMPLGELTDIGPGCDVVAVGQKLGVRVGPGLLGRVLNGLGEPIDDKGPIIAGEVYPLYAKPPHPLLRKPVATPLPVGVKAIDALLTLGRGQRVGIFSGSGVGKSTLMGMMVRNTEAEISVIGLIGERGREVGEFLERDLGSSGLKRSVVVVATSDQPPLIRLKAALTATAIAEYFRDRGKDVLLLMDSVTRVAMAQRDVGLAIGEPPATRGYTPSVFAFLPKLLERAGAGERGSITGVYNVLVEGDDMNEPVADTVRGILDGHIVLSRKLASKGHYPAIDVLRSVSRVMPNITSQEHLEAARRVRELLAIYEDAEDLVNIGAYKEGSNINIDWALRYLDDVLDFLCQPVEGRFSFEETVKKLISLAPRGDSK